MYYKFLVIINVATAFLYFPLRSIVDSPMWIVLPAALCVFYFIPNLGKVIHHKYNALDILLVILFLYGVLSTVLGILIFEHPETILQAFVYFYLPLVLFFLLRIYAINQNVTTLLRQHLIIIWWTGLIFSSLVVSEYVLLEVLKVPGNTLPWYKIQFSEQVINRTVISVLLKSHSAGYLMSVFLAIFFPLYLYKDYSNNIFKQNRLFVWIYVGLLVFSLYVLSVTTSQISTLLVFFIFFILFSRIKQMVMLIVIISLIVVIFNQEIGMYIRNEINAKFLVENESGHTPLNMVLNFSTLIDGYQRLDFLTLILGKSMMPLLDEGQQSISFSEMRILSYPAYFGLLWGIIMILIQIVILFYIIRCILIKRTKIFGYMFFSFFLVTFFDFHYGTFIYRGPLQIWLIMLSMLSITYSYRHKLEQSEKEMKYLTLRRESGN